MKNKRDGYCWRSTKIAMFYVAEVLVFPLNRSTCKYCPKNFQLKIKEMEECCILQSCKMWNRAEGICLPVTYMELCEYMWLSKC